MSIRIRTGYSFRRAAGQLPDVLARLVECGFSHAPITDTNSTFGYVRWSKLLKDTGLRPIFGVELFVSPSVEAKRPVFDSWTFIAKDTIKPVNELLGTATSQFRYNPLLTYFQANEAKDVFRIVGSRADLSLVVPSEDTYLSISTSSSLAYVKAGIAKGLRPIAACDNYYVNSDDEGFYQVLIGRTAGTQAYSRHILSDKEWLDEMFFNGFSPELLSEALANRDDVFERSVATLRKGKLLVPAKAKSLRDMCIEAAPSMRIDLSEPVYSARLERELTLIEDKKFEDYFYIVGDIVRWARQRMTVGPARGSSAGSLVCMLLGITTVDPIKFDLIFERFIDVTRMDYPDIDIDFPSEGRDLVFRYMSETYGSNSVARLGSVNMFKAASAIKNSCVALEVPTWEAKYVMDSVEKRTSGDIRAWIALGESIYSTQAGKQFIEKYPEMAIASRLETHPSHAGQHAAGMILTDIPVVNYVAVDGRTGAVFLDKKDAEDLELLKIDALGLTQLDIFYQCLTMLGLPHDFLDSLPLDDLASFEVLNRRNFAGVFQFTGPALQNVANQIYFSSIEDIIAATALARPGPMGGGATTKWIRRKSGKEEITYPHPTYEPHTGVSFGVLIYQEQIMTLCKHIGDMSWDDVTALRKGMSKSWGSSYFVAYGEKFKKGAIEKGVNPAIVDRLWEDICSYGNMCFNRGHSAAYGLVSYYCCWLKAHHPMEFAAASLNHIEDPDAQIAFLREMNNEGVDYIPVDTDLSTDRWVATTVGNSRKLVGPISGISGIGPALVRSFMSAKARKEPIPDRLKKLLVDPKTKIDSLWPIRDRFKALVPDLSARNIHTTPKTLAQIKKEGIRQQVVALVCFKKLNKRDLNEAVNAAKRGGVLITDGKHTTLNVTMEDDTGMMLGTVNRYKFDEIGKPIVDRGKAGKALYAVKGTVWTTDDFMGLSIEIARYIGEL